MGTPFPGPTFLQSGVLRAAKDFKERFLPWDARSQAGKTALSMETQGPWPPYSRLRLAGRNANDITAVEMLQ